MNKDRLIMFVDAVFAIVMTILVINLKMPNPVTVAGFLALKVDFFAYALSFFWLGTMWVNLYIGWQRIERINLSTIWTTLIMMFFTSLFPYATNLVAENFYNISAQVFYSVIVIVIPVFSYLSYNAVGKLHQDDEVVLGIMNHRKKWLSADLVVKFIALVVSLTFPIDNLFVLDII